LSLSRFWLVPEDMRFKSADNLLLFDRGRMTVKTEVIGASAGEKLADPHNESFARFFTDHYDEIARKHPIYRNCSTMRSSRRWPSISRKAGFPFSGS